jgi:hypothetical protein
MIKTRQPGGFFIVENKFRYALDAYAMVAYIRSIETKGNGYGHD